MDYIIIGYFVCMVIAILFIRYLNKCLDKKRNSTDIDNIDAVTHLRNTRHQADAGSEKTFNYLLDKDKK